MPQDQGEAQAEARVKEIGDENDRREGVPDVYTPVPAATAAEPWTALFARMRRGIAARLLIGVLLFSSAVTLLLTAGQLYLDYRYDVNLIEQRLKEVGAGYPGIIGESLWDLDRTHLQIELEGILKLPDMRAVEVRETGTVDPLVVTVGRRQTGSVLTRELPITHVIDGAPRKIGTLYVEATLTGVYQRLLDKGLIILVSQAAKTFLVSLFIIFIFHRLVTRHLAVVAAFASGYDFHRPSTALRLRRRPPAIADELDQVVTSFNELCASLQTAYGNLQKANAELERDIAIRIKNENALRETEQRYRHLFHNMPVALLEMRGNFDMYDGLRAQGISDSGAYLDQHPELFRRLVDAITIEEVNDRSVELFHARDAKELVGSAARFWSESPGTLRRALESRFRGESRFEEEMRVATLDGHVIDVLCTISRLQPISGNSPTLFGLVDITERVRAREKLQQLEADFAHAARVSMLGELTASIAHEIAQPIGAIATCAEASLRWLNRPEPEVAEVLELTRRALADTQRATAIIARIRAMAVREAPHRTLISLDEVIRESLLFLRYEIQSNDVTVSHTFNPGAPKVLADRTQIQQVIVNLAINAMQAMAHAGTVSRKIALSVAIPEPGMLRCTVEDNGPGIGLENFSGLFDRFFTTKDGGLGLGLSISRSIIEAHGGRISVDNETIHRGARFYFTLPTTNAAE
ncbi:hypothetical protein AYM40_29290 [Paraburkholderia phytofirmans OLGA172]|uniref:histidine kinase n=1 Tax=Paraburkholderia phytofirmans OLGA172 TaxID=1417228 RepID=A0A160FTJ9_9BURK|nr:ATP-binding protein [Paraburkholderia phytofirmans]ANB76341.1 hypothetical protein AYM40_29290 [Paraburkholderia phytofirmans OLGA172]